MVLGILAWASAAITILGFALAIWQILKVRRAAEAARAAALGLAHRVRSRELLAKLGDAHTHLEAARDLVGRGERQIALLRLELASGCSVEALEISRTLGGSEQTLDILVYEMTDLIQRLRLTFDPLTSHPDFVQLQLQLGRAVDRLQRIRAHSRYQYDVGEE